MKLGSSVIQDKKMVRKKEKKSNFHDLKASEAV